ncbi:MAG: SPFH domain-containing protein, partial [Alistipes sp.]|nr:SPFH domain-containing protein [Alistipes sp.]
MKNYTYSGWKLNGFVALLLNLALVALMVYSIVVLASSVEIVVWALVALIVSAICAVLMLCGYIMLEPNES